MIAKHVALQKPGKSDFAGLVQYITDGQNKTERLGQVNVTNCQAGTLQAVIGEVLATQRINTRAVGDKTCHLLIAFPPGEHPNAKILHNIESRICAALGYGAHQRVSAVHHDTDHLHLHVAINKIHPARYTLHEPFQSYRTLAEICTKLEIEQGLQQVNHASKRSLSEGHAVDMERHAGIESLISWIRRECLEEMKGAQSWPDLHRVMRENGLALRARANGLVIVSEDGTLVKASTVSRDLSKPKLVARLGVFEKSPARQTPFPTKRSYRKDPVRLSVDTVELYARYQSEQQNRSASRAEALAIARREKDRAVEDAKRASRLWRAAINITDGKGINKKRLYVQAGKRLKAKMETIHTDYRTERKRLYQDFQRRTWADWLRQEALNGNAEALTALRSRGTAQGFRGNSIQADGKPQSDHVPVIDNITKHGTIIYRFGHSAVRDDGNRLQVSRDATQEGLIAALRIAIARYGQRVTVHGSAGFKRQILHAAVDSGLPITFADRRLDRQRQDLVAKKATQQTTSIKSSKGRRV